MAKKRMKSVFALLLCVVMVLNMATAGMAAGPKPSMTLQIVEDYTEYADDAALRAAYKANANGDTNSVALVDSPFTEGGKAMTFTYNLASSGYSGVAHAIEQDWEGATTLNVWIQGDGKGQDILFQLGDGDLYSGSNYTFECHLNDLAQFDKTSLEPQYLEIPIEAFKVKSGNRTLDLTHIQSFAMYVNAASGKAAENSTITLGSVKVAVPKKVYTKVVEDYTQYADDAALRAAYTPNANGDTNSVALIASPFEEGEKAMRFTYNLASSGYSGAVRSIDQDWGTAESLCFWFQGDGKGQDILIQLGDGDLYSGTNYTFECHLNDLEQFDKTSLEPQYLEIPIEAFKVKSGTRTLDLSHIQSFAMYVNAVSGKVAEDSTLTLGVVVAVLSEKPGDPDEPVPSKDANIDTFEDYADSASLAQTYVRDTTGGTNTVSLVKSTFEGGGKNAMSMTYNTSGPGYSGVVRAISQDWTGAKSLQLQYLGNGLSGQSILLRLETGTEGNWMQTDLLDLRGFDPYYAGIQNIELALDSFTPLTEGAVLDLSKVLSFGIYVKQLGGDSRNGTLVFDNISWSESVPAVEPPCYEVSFDSKEWTATGTDTLMSVLRSNAQIKALEDGLPASGEEPYILQVLYSGNNSNILKNSGQFSSKGVFRSEGTLKVKIQEVTVYADGRQYFVSVNETVTIHVSDLAEPVDVLTYLQQLQGNGTLSAMHNKEPNAKPRTSTDRIMETTGVTPAIWSGDFLFMKDDVANRQKMIDEAIHQWNDGALINIMFHVPSPLRTVEQEKEGAAWSARNDPEKNCVQCNLTTEEWASLLTEGEPLNTNWKLRLDEYAYYLQQLKDAGVVPMVRPFHEMNQHAFWWANVPANTAALYRLTKDYLVNEKGLDNMLWIWDLQDFDNRMNWEDYNPGNEYWDILALDVYSGGYSDKYYEQMQRFGEGKLIAIGECWNLIQPSQLAKYSDYVFAMPWADDTWNMNSAENIQAFYDNTKDLLQTPTFASRSEVSSEFRYVLDDFEDYASTAELQAAYSRVRRGGTNSVSLVPSGNSANGGNAMQLTYTLNNSGYSGLTHAIKGYWPGMEGISLWFKGDGLAQDVALQLVSGATYEAHLSDAAGYNARSTEWQHLVVPVDAFAPKSGDAPLNPKSISSFAIYVYAVDGTQVSNSVLTFDDFMVIFPEEPQLPELIVDNLEMTASGSDNLITTLRRNTTVTCDGRLDLIQYEIDDSGILDAADSLVPKGIFRAEGTVELVLKKAQIYADGNTFQVELNQAVTIHVSGLDAPVDVLDYFKAISGKDMITALHNQEPNSDPDKQTSQLVSEIGITPAMWSGDFLYAKSDVANRQTMIDEAIRQWNNGAIIQLMLHVAPPTMTVEEEKNGCAWDDRTSGNQKGVQCYLSAEQWKDLLTDGTDLNTNWKLRLDEYASYMQQLKDAGATVLFRPFHEMNQHVFWWGGELGEYGTMGLYRMTRDYLENVKGLDNLIWVWDMQDLPADYAVENSTHQPLPESIPPYDASNLQLFNPGEDYWDIFAIDFYDAAGYTSFWYEQACAIVADSGKPMIIGEAGTIISEEEWAAQPQWAMCMPWAGQVFSKNTLEARLAYYNNHLSVEDTPTFAARHNCPSKDFVDVPGEDSWSHEGIDFCVRNGYMQGISNARFSPNGTLTRAQLVTILYRIAGSPEAAYTGVFTDVADGKWYTAAVEWAAANNVVYGTGNGRFSPNSLLTREQLATILYRYSGSPEVSDSLADFADSAAVGKYAKDAMAWAVETGIIQGIRSGDLLNLNPKGNTTRAQAAVIIMRYLTT